MGKREPEDSVLVDNWSLILVDCCKSAHSQLQFWQVESSWSALVGASKGCAGELTVTRLLLLLTDAKVLDVCMVLVEAWLDTAVVVVVLVVVVVVLVVVSVMLKM